MSLIWEYACTACHSFCIQISLIEYLPTNIYFTHIHMMYDKSIEWSQDKSTPKYLRKEKETGKYFPFSLKFKSCFRKGDKVNTVYIPLAILK